MNKSIGLRVTVEYDCPNMTLENDFKKTFKSDAVELYNYISDNNDESPESFSKTRRIIKVEVMKEIYIKRETK